MATENKKLKNFLTPVRVIWGLVALVFVVLFVGSYVFIWQPFYGYIVEENDYELEANQMVVDDTNGYLIRQKDGNYIFYVTDSVFEIVPKEEVEQGMYEGYPIYEE